MVKNSGNQHVVPYHGKWAVRGAGNSRITSSHRTQQAAINAARKVARHQGGETLVHGRNGQIRARDTTAGHDPRRTRG